MGKVLPGFKTHMVVVFAIIATIVGFVNGDTDAGSTVVRIMECLSVSTLRVGVSGQLDFLKGIKTYILSGLQLVTVALQFYTGDISAGETLNAAMMAVGFSAFRLGISTSTTTSSK